MYGISALHTGAPPKQWVGHFLACMWVGSHAPSCESGAPAGLAQTVRTPDSRGPGAG